MFVAHDSHQVDVVRRDGDAWSQTRGGAGESIRLESIGCDVPVDAVYRDPLA